MLRLVGILRLIRRSTLLITVGLVGGTVTAAGVVMLVTPGPGLVVIVAGLAILATQFAWAERALDKVKRQAIAARNKASARRAVTRSRRAETAGAGAGPAAADSVTDFPAPAGRTGASPTVDGWTPEDLALAGADLGNPAPENLVENVAVESDNQATG